jgi:hypothetical protein
MTVDNQLLSQLRTTSDPIPELARNALTSSPEGAEARSVLERFGFEVKSVVIETGGMVQRRTQPDYVLAAPNRGVLGPISLPVDWSPKLEYRLRPQPDGCSVEIESTGEHSATVHTSVNRTQADSPGHLPDRHWDELSIALRQVTDHVSGKGRSLFAHLPSVQSLKESAASQQKRYHDEAVELLRFLRQVLVAWGAVVLSEVPEGPVPPMEGHEWILAPERSVPGSNGEKSVGAERENQRQALADNYSAYGRFLREVEWLWTLVTERQIEHVRMSMMAEPFDVPETVTESARETVEVLYSALETIDKHIVSSMALEAACQITEAFVVEQGEPPPIQKIIEGPTPGQIADAQLILDNLDNDKPADDFASYEDLKTHLDNEWPLGMSEREAEKKSSESLVKQAKRCLNRLVERHNSASELVERLRKVDEEGKLHL